MLFRRSAKLISLIPIRRPSSLFGCIPTRHLRSVWYLRTAMIRGGKINRRSTSEGDRNKLNGPRDFTADSIAEPLVARARKDDVVDAQRMILFRRGALGLFAHRGVSQRLPLCFDSHTEPWNTSACGGFASHRKKAAGNSDYCISALREAPVRRSIQLRSARWLPAAIPVLHVWRETLVSSHRQFDQPGRAPR